jgi:hypothetical protein
MTKQYRVTAWDNMYPNAEAANIASGDFTKMRSMFRPKTTIIANTGEPCLLVLPKMEGKFPRVDIECIAREAVSEDIWINKTMAAISMNMVIYNPIAPNEDWAKGKRGDKLSARIPLMPKVPVATV